MREWMADGCKDYTVVILAIAALFSVVNRFLHGRTHYQGPRIHMESIEAGIH